MVINSTTGQITWTPAQGQTSPATVVVQATDPAGNTAQQQYAVTVLSTNSAPVLIPATSSPSMGTTPEDTVTTIDLATFINASPGTSTQITDSDTDAVIGGIALTGVTGKGTWAYSLDGGATFVAVGTISDSSALLLPKDAELQYTPGNNGAETPTVTYQAWDTTGGADGVRADLSQFAPFGDPTPFSVATDTATLTVTAVNHAPVLTPASPALWVALANATTTIGVWTLCNNGPGTTTVTDQDQGAVLGGIAVVGVVGKGTWNYTTDGSTYTAVGSVSDTSALLLPSNAQLQYIPDGSDSETATVTYRAWDITSGSVGGLFDVTTNGGESAFSAATDTASITINDSPGLTAAHPSLGTTNEDTSSTIPLTNFINNTAGTGTIITDPNPNDAVGGIALTGATGNGGWVYSIDGGTTYHAVGAVSQSSALLLAKDAELVYTPDSMNGETATITYQAWDATSGANGTSVDLTTEDYLSGTSAFSTDSDTASLTVTSVNDAPILTAANPSLGTTSPTVATTVSLTTFINNGAGTTTVTDVDNGAVLGGIAVTGTTGKGTWAYSTDSGATFTAVGDASNSSALLLPANASLRYTPDGTDIETATITYRAWDTTTGTSGQLSDTTTNGGTSAFSAVTDTASLTVTATANISGYVYANVDNDGLRITPSGQPHMGIPGVVITLSLQASDGTWTQVAGKSPIMTGSDGSYHFSGLVAGNYQIQESQPANFLDGQDTVGTIAGVTTGTSSTDQLQVQLGDGQNGIEYNFGEQGLNIGMISLRMSLASTPTDSQIFVQMDTPPVVTLSQSSAGNGYSTTFTVGSNKPVAIAATDAAISDADSAMLASLTATISNLKDGDSEQLAATTTGTSITSTYANGVLTLSGVADLADYDKALESITYSNTAASPNTVDRTIDILANDGIADGLPATATVKLSAAAAVDAVLGQGDPLST